MFRKAMLASFLVLAVTSCSYAGTERWPVLEVTPDGIKVGGAAKSAVYKFSNALLTNTVPWSQNPSSGKVTDVKPGCNILLGIGAEGGRIVITEILRVDK
jgi:hypothetical protein